ncbi:crop [Symbiodinium sp. KB8]|nr:crop [Symbiodinium sp. KB8]
MMDVCTLLGDARSLEAEYTRLQTAGEEQEAADEIRIHDAQLERLRLRTLLERYRERQPKAEELAERYEAEIDQLSEEQRQLQDENALLAHRDTLAMDLLDGGICGTPSSRTSRGSRTSPSVGAFASPSRAAVRRTYNQAKEMRQCQARLTALQRRTQVNEWYLSQLKVGLQEGSRSLQSRENHLRDLRERFDAAEEQRHRLAEERNRTERQLTSEREELVQLHKEALALREACYLPAQLKKKSSTLMKFLEEGGRVKMEKHLRGREAVVKLYHSVAQQAPDLQAAAGRVKSEMDLALRRYQELQQEHSRLLQLFHLTLATWGAIHPGQAKAAIAYSRPPCAGLEATMGNAVTTCGQLLPCDLLRLDQRSARAEGCRGGVGNEEQLQVALKVAFAFPQDELASAKFPFKTGQELALSCIEKVKAWSPLTLRQDRAAHRNAQTSKSSSLWPTASESRFARPWRAWSVKIWAPTGDGDVEEFWGLLQVPLAKEHRDIEKVKEVIKEVQCVADYAHKFNQHIARAAGEELDSAPAIRVAVPVGCFVLDSINPHIADAGDALMLTLFDAASVTKFVFEGAEDFQELPQAFFHYVAWSSGGQEMVADLQGIQDEQDFLLVDPVLIRPQELSLSSILSARGGGVNSTSLTSRRLDEWHPRCGQLCRAFDPQRRGGTTRRACGVRSATDAASSATLENLVGNNSRMIAANEEDDDAVEFESQLSSTGLSDAFSINATASCESLLALEWCTISCTSKLSYTCPKARRTAQHLAAAILNGRRDCKPWKRILGGRFLPHGVTMPHVNDVLTCLSHYDSNEISCKLGPTGRQSGLKLDSWLGQSLEALRAEGAMNKARAMLDALMGPNRNEKEVDKAKAKEKFKDPGVCKSFLIGLCPLDRAYLGGKRQFKPCEKIHSEIMRDQFITHPDADELRRQYEADTLPSLEFAVRECEARIADEKGRIRDDWGRRRPPLPVPVIDKLSAMKRESSAKVKQAESLDDDKFQEKARLMAEAEDLTKEAAAVEEEETKKAIAAAVPEEVCDICGTCYQGAAADAAHKQFKIHNSYQEIRNKLDELKPRVDEWRKRRQDQDPKTERSEKRSKAEDPDSKQRDRSRRGTSAGPGTI